MATQKRTRGDAREAAVPKPTGLVPVLLGYAGSHLEQCRSEVITYARHSPGKALLTALAGGYLLRMLPLTRILFAAFRLLLAALKPVSFILAVAKVYQAIQPNKANDQ